MIEEQSVGVVIPCRECLPAVRLLLQDLPAFVDRVVVVDDGSSAETLARLRREHDPARRAGARLTIVRHTASRGLGAAVVTGYRTLLVSGIDLAVVAWPGDALDPGEVEALLRPLLERRADLVTGSRLGSGGPRLSHLRSLVAARLLGWALGTGGTPDAHCPHHAISGVALRRLPLSDLERGDAFALDLAAHAHAEGLVTESIALRPFQRRSAGLPRATFAVVGRTALRRLWRRRRPRVLPATARSHARVAAARALSTPTAHLPETTP